MTIIDLDTLVIGRVLEVKKDLSHLTLEEKLKYKKDQAQRSNIKRNLPGSLDIIRFAILKLKCMTQATEDRNKQRLENGLEFQTVPEWTVNEIVDFLNEHRIYTVDSVLGSLEFPLMLTNGYYNTASFDRINDDIGYTKTNVQLRPYFLNVLCKFTCANIAQIVNIREHNQNYDELKEIADAVNLWTSNTVRNSSAAYIYNIATSVKHNAKKKNTHRNITFDFKSNKDCAICLIKKYVEQGGRCLYTHVPIYPDSSKGCFKLSIERKDPTKSYSEENIALICAGINGTPAGVYKSKHITEEIRSVVLAAGMYNQEYWDSCTKMTNEIEINCKKAREYGRNILMKLVKLDISDKNAEENEDNEND